MRAIVLLPFLLLAGWKKPPQPSYEIETLYVIHKNVTQEACIRIEGLLARAYPKLNRAKLQPTEEMVKEYFGLHADRLIRQVSADTDPETVSFEKGWSLVRKQARREVWIRIVFYWFLKQAKENGNVRAVFDHLVRKDDRDRPICAAKPGKGLIIYRRVVGTAKQFQDLKDGEAQFGHEFSKFVQRVSEEEALPGFGERPEALGPGRFIVRVLRVHKTPKSDVK